MPVRKFKQNQEFLADCTSLCNEGLKVVLKNMGTTCSIYCRNHTNVTHISAGTGFWTYIDWDFFAYLSEHYSLKAS
jgi:hypothetical protein